MRQHDAVEVGADRTWHPGIVIEEALFVRGLSKTKRRPENENVHPHLDTEA